MSLNDLKWIAMITMLVDHIGMILFPQQLLFRIIGRISFPLFAFILVQGFWQTKNRGKYFTRLLIMGFLVEPIYDLSQGHSVSLLANRSNIFFTLAFGLAIITIVQVFSEGRLSKFKMRFLLIAIVIFAIAISADYGPYGLIVIYLMYHKQHLFRNLFLLNLFYIGFQAFYAPFVLIQFAMLASVYLINKYHAYSEVPISKWIGYGFYPLHLILLYFISGVIH